MNTTKVFEISDMANDDFWKSSLEYSRDYYIDNKKYTIKGSNSYAENSIYIANCIYKQYVNNLITLDTFVSALNILITKPDFNINEIKINFSSDKCHCIDRYILEHTILTSDIPLLKILVENFNIDVNKQDFIGILINNKDILSCNTMIKYLIEHGSMLKNSVIINDVFSYINSLETTERALKRVTDRCGDELANILIQQCICKRKMKRI